MKGLNLFQKLLFFLNLLAVLVLLLAYLSVWINPNTAPWLALLGLFYPLWAALNVFFVMIWTLQLKKQAITSLAALLLGYPFFSASFQWRTKEAHRSETNLRVMTYNVRNFNVHRWLSGPKTVKEGIENLVDTHQPDVIFFQEYMEYFLTPELPDYKKYFQKTAQTHSFGFATYSKFPVLNTGLVSYNLENTHVVGDFAFTDLKIGTDTIRVFNVHLASIGLEFHKYGFIKEPLEADQTEIERDLKEIAKRLLRAFELRGQQMPILLNAIQESPYPVMVCGDINDPPLSYAAFQLSRKLKDSYRTSGSGWAKTFVKAPFPLRIDYIFYPPEMEAFNHQIIPEIHSDHYPVMVDFKLPKS